MNKNEKYILCALLIVVILMLVYFFKSGNSFSSNLLPELIGLLLDASFLGILFTWFQRKESFQKSLADKNKLKNSMRSQLAIFFQWAHPVNSEVHSAKVITNKKAIKTIASELQIGGYVDDVSMDFIKLFSKREMPSLEALLPVAAALGPSHLMAWSLIISNLKGVRDSKNNHEAQDATVKFLHYVENFDDLEIET